MRRTTLWPGISRNLLAALSTKNVPLPATIANTIAVEVFDHNAMEDLWIAITWAKS